MSVDFQCAFPCPHFIDEEKAAIDTDRVSVLTRQPLFGMGLVRVTANNQWVIPASGFFSSATLRGSTVAPFRIPLNQNVVTVKATAGSYAVTIPLGYQSTDVLVSLFNNPAMGVLATNMGGMLQLEELTSVGASSFLRVDGPGAAAIGFGIQNGSTGQLVYPGWTLIRQAPPNVGYTIQFLSPFKAGGFLRVSYPVPQEYCLRCLGSGVENDYGFDANGNPLMVQDENLLYQSSLKMLLTKAGSNVNYPWYGSILTTLIGSKGLNSSGSAIQTAVLNCLQTFQKVQQQQAQYQTISPKERLYSIAGVSVSQVPNSPTVYLVSVTVRNFSNDRIDLTIVYTTPGTVALAGTNGLSLGGT